MFLCVQPTDMRKSYEGLGALTQTVLQQNPLSGHLFVFMNKKRDRVKLLYWHLNGFCIWQKRLEKGQFYLTAPQGLACLPLSLYQLSGLFQGLNWQALGEARSLSYRVM